MEAENTSAEGGDAGRGRVNWSAANSRLEIINKTHQLPGALFVLLVQFCL